ncbi:hypothetical protein G4B88_006072 [Cannabis sativa]|uniref:Uncharacterized protein n=1 Tax=Cannabis sativa TaxID=3483 RepID=A0A7J6IBP6_CANSA|nr:hypothetical protein G4B88_006072 [Cannabis sativa]
MALQSSCSNPMMHKSASPSSILRDLNKRIPDNIIVKTPSTSNVPALASSTPFIPWGSDGEAFRESSGTISSSDSHIVDPVAAAEEIAFCRACARFGLGLNMMEPAVVLSPFTCFKIIKHSILLSFLLILVAEHRKTTSRVIGLKDMSQNVQGMKEIRRKQGESKL